MQRLLGYARFLVILPTSSHARSRGQFNAANTHQVRLDHKLKSRPKPISQSGHQARTTPTRIEGGVRTALANQFGDLEFSALQRLVDGNAPRNALQELRESHQSRVLASLPIADIAIPRIAFANI